MSAGYLVVGHVCVDHIPAADGTWATRLGGTALYSGLAAARLGHATTVLTTCTKATASAAARILGADVTLEVRDSPVDTEFWFDRGTGHGPSRVGAVAAACGPLPPGAAPAIVHLAPIAGEIEPATVAQAVAGGAYVGVTAQGLMRGFDADGRVVLAAAPGLADLVRADAVVVNEREFGVLTAAAAMPEWEGYLVVTRGGHGADIHRDGQLVAQVASEPVAQAANTVGAGDVFAAALFAALASGASPQDALEQAHATAGGYVAGGGGVDALGA